MPDAAEGRHHATDPATNPGVTTATDLAVIGHRFGKCHADASAQRCRQANQECLPCIFRGDGRGEDRSQCRNRPIHETGQPRLHDLQHELALRLILGCCLDQVCFVVMVRHRPESYSMGSSHLPV